MDPALPFKPPKSVSIAVPSAAYSNQHDAQHDGEGDETDAVAWPTNRCCYEELTAHELAAVEQLFAARDDAPSFMKWVVVHRPPQTFAPRLLVLSPFRAWLVKRRQAPFRNSLVVSKELQLLHLVDLRVLRLATYQPSDPTMLAVSIKMRFRKERAERQDDNCQDAAFDASPIRGSDERDELHFDPGVHGETIVRLCQRSLHALRLAFPSQRLPRLSLPRQCNWQEFFTLRDSHRRDGTHQTPRTQADRKAYGDAMAMACRAFCDDLGVPARASVASRLRECLDAACVDVPYCLRVVPSSAIQPVIPARHHAAWRGAGLLASLAHLLGLEAFSTAAMQRLEVLALARTLAHCHDGFEEVLVYDTALSTEALGSLFQALRADDGSAGTGVRGLSLTNVGLTTASLRALQHIVLQSTIRQGGGGGTGTATATTGLALRRLDLSFNAFSALMAHALATTLELLPGGLEALQLEQCRLSMLASARVLGAMRASHGFSSALRELNLAGNTLGMDGTRALALWITGAFALHALDLSRTRLQTDAFFRAFQQNSILHESSLRALDLSYNRLGTFASRALGDILGKTQSLATLVLRGMKQSLLHPRRLLGDLSGGRRHRVTPTRGLTTAQLTSVLGPMLLNRARAAACRVDLSENDLRGAKAAALARLVDSAPSGALASLRVDHTALTDKHAVLLLHALRGSRALASLSLEGNGFTRRATKRSYRRFHRETAAKAVSAIATDAITVNASASKVPPAIERAAADALALLLGGKTSGAATDGDDSLAQLYLPHHAHHGGHDHTKRVPLRELSLRAPGGSGVVFGERILTGVADALATNATLQLLDVSGNECGDALARALGRALPQNATLRALYWDDNFTTVEGFGAFYDGLLRNQTLSVVQLPINDTRRILEEQKDPPRERLFSVLGKIFKVTERNQTLRDRRRRNHKSPTHCTAAHGENSAAAAPSGSPRHRRRERGDNQAADATEAKTKTNTTRREPEDDVKPEQDDEEESKAEAPVAPTQVTVAVAASTRLAEDKDEERDSADASWAARYATRPARYPTTIQSWSRDGLAAGAASSGSSDDHSVRASWDQIGSLAAMLT